MTQTFGHGDYIEGYGSIVGSYNLKSYIVYVCYIPDQGCKDYIRKKPK